LGPAMTPPRPPVIHLAPGPLSCQSLSSCIFGYPIFLFRLPKGSGLWHGEGPHPGEAGSVPNAGREVKSTLNARQGPSTVEQVRAISPCIYSAD
jgi:hypothetical protein